MDEMNDDDNLVFRAVDYALRTYPLKPAPDDFLPAVMKRIQARQLTPDYLPTWIEVALSLFAVVLLAYLYWLWSIFQIPLNWNERLELQVLVWWQYVRQWFAVRPWLVLYGLVLSLGIICSMMLFKAVWLSLNIEGDTKKGYPSSSVK